MFLRRQSKEHYFIAKLLYTDRKIVEVCSSKGLVNVHRKGSMPLILSPSPDDFLFYFTHSVLFYIFEKGRRSAGNYNLTCIFKWPFLRSERE